MKTAKINDVHADNTTWLNNLAFYADDILVMRHRLEDVVKNNNSKDILAQVEHFQNQLFIQGYEINKLKHAIKLRERYIENNIYKSYSEEVDAAELIPKDKEDIETFEKIFNELRRELNLFLAKIL